MAIKRPHGGIQAATSGKAEEQGGVPGALYRRLFYERKTRQFEEERYSYREPKGKKDTECYQC